MSQLRFAILSEGLCGDLRPLCYGRSTWDVPFLGRPLLYSALQWMHRRNLDGIFLLDDTPGLWMHELCRRLHLDAPHVHLVDARGGGPPPTLPRPGGRVLLTKPCALLEPDVDDLEAFHEDSEATATFALVRLNPSALTWPYIPACRMDMTGRILEVEKLRRTDTLGSASLDNVLGTGAPSRTREYWAPRNVAILETELMSCLPLGELCAPLAGLARSLAQNGVLCYGRSMKGHWWPASTTKELMQANRDALIELRTVAPRRAGEEAPSWSSTDGTVEIMHEPERIVSHEAASFVPRGEEAVVHDEAMVEDGVYLAEHVRVEKGARILGRSVIGRHCVVAEGALVNSSVLEENVRVAPDCTVEFSMIGRDSVLPEGIRLRNAVKGRGEVQNLSRGVPPGGLYVDGLRSVDESTVSGYWPDAPIPGRPPRFESLRTLARGIENNVYGLYDGKDSLVLKRRLDCNALPLIREFHVLRSLEEEGVAPRPVCLDLRPEIPFSPCIVMEYLKGTRVKAGHIDESLAERIGQTCRRVHGLPVANLLRDLPELSEASYPDLRSYAYFVIEQYQSYLLERRQQGLQDERLEAATERMLDWVQQVGEHENVHWHGRIPRSLCQGDLREFNMVVREDGNPAFNGRVALLDWERCGVDDPAYDLAWFLALARLNPEVEQALRRGYGEGLPDDGTFWKRVEAFRTLDVITWPIFLIQMVQGWTEAHGAREDAAELARTYEQDAYEALAEAFRLFARYADGTAGEVTAYCSAESLRLQSRLFMMRS